MASKPIYQIYAELEEYEPKIWRRFQVMNDITVARLAYILMTLFEMQGSHLYKFEVDELDNYITNHLEHYNKYFKDYDKDDVDELFGIGQYGCIFENDYIFPIEDKRYRELKDAKDVRLKYILNEENEKMEFKYDFGDNWRFKVVLEKIFEDNNIKGKDLPRVIEGEGFGIIEDCGGVRGLIEIREACKNKNGEGYIKYSNWLGKKELDLGKCDLEDLNFRLKKLPRIFKESYEYGLEPSEYSIKILDREYINN